MRTLICFYIIKCIPTIKETGRSIYCKATNTASRCRSNTHLGQSNVSSIAKTTWVCQKGLLTATFKRLLFAQNLKPRVAFFLNEVIFLCNFNPADRAWPWAPRVCIWRKETEGLSCGCTAKGSHGDCKFNIVLGRGGNIKGVWGNTFAVYHLQPTIYSLYNKFQEPP